MRETEFINQNKEKWEEFEQVLEGKKPNPKKLSELFVQITDDLSYSRTFYPNRSVRVYLNSVAQRVFFLIYKNRKSNQNRLMAFWTDELPELIYESRQAFRLSLFVFLLSMAIGMLSCAMEPGFANLILGDRYVEMTKEFIDSGDPMKVYKDSGRFDMFLGITLNNLYVAFLTFVLGALFILGSVIILVYNGIMVGTFQYFFIERDLFWDSFLTIWIHGTFEISAIIIAGAAGITMGQGLLFPGTYTRMQAFQQSARRGIKIMIGIIPIFIVAAFFEGYLTRQTETPDIIRGLFIAICLLIILGYFVWYPWVKSRVGFKKRIESNRLPPSQTEWIAFNQINSNSRIFEDLFRFLRINFKTISLVALGVTLMYTIIILLFSGRLPDELFFTGYPPFQGFATIRQYFNSEESVLLPIIAMLSVGAVTFIVIHSLRLLAQEGEQVRYSLMSLLGDYIRALFGSAAVCVSFVLAREIAVIVLPFVIPYFFIWSQVMIIEKLGPVSALGRAWALNRSAFGRGIGLYIVLFLLGTLFFTISDSAVTSLFIGVLEWVIYFEQSVMDQISVVLEIGIIFFIMLLIYAMVASGIGLLYYTMKEILEANHLFENIETVGQTKKLRGLERE